MATIQKCKSCSWHISPDKCQLLKIIVNPEDDFCSHHRLNIPVCDICGQPAYKNTILDSDSKTIHLICSNCFSMMRTCRLCDHASTCSFETDPSPLPKTIQQKVQRGPYQTVTTIKNPERIRETCQKGCKCFDPENGCLRQITQTCSNNQFTYKN